MSSVSSLENYYPSIIRLLDVQAIGPYLVQRGVLSSHEYYDSFAGPLEKGETSNYKLSMKLANKCLKKPKKFYEALEESLSYARHTNHQELLELLPDQIMNSDVDVFADQDTNGLSNSEDTDNHDTKQKRNGTFSLSELSEMESYNSLVALNGAQSSLTFADNRKLQHAKSTGSLNIPISCNTGKSFDHIRQSGSENILPQLSPTVSLRHQRTGTSSTSLSHNNITAVTIQQGKTQKEIQDLYQQSKLEIEMLKEKNKSQAENIEKLQSECDGLRSQLKEFERIKERSSLLKETLEKTNEENQKLNQQVILAKVEGSALNEKLAAKIENEGILKAAKVKLEENLQTMQAKHESLAVQLESTSVKLESKLEKINSIETRNKELCKQANEFRLKLSQHQIQIQVDQSAHQRELAKEQQKYHKLLYQIEEKDKKINDLERKMEVSSLNLKQLQEMIAILNDKEPVKGTLIVKNFSKVDPNSIETFRINGYETDCTKQDLIDIIEAHVDQIEALHQKLYLYDREVTKLQQKLKRIL